MKRINITTTNVAVVALLMAACDKASTESSDAKMKKALVGTWRNLGAVEGGGVVEGQTTYLSDGNANLTGTVKSNGNEDRITAQMTWHIKDGYLYTTLEGTNRADMLLVGAKSVHKILGVTEKDFTYVDGELGKTKAWTRIK